MAVGHPGPGPLLVVLDGDGKLVKSENADALEDGSTGYSAKAVKEFLTAWKTP